MYVNVVPRARFVTGGRRSAQLCTRCPIGTHARALSEDFSPPPRSPSSSERADRLTKSLRSAAKTPPPQEETRQQVGRAIREVPRVEAPSELVAPLRQAAARQRADLPRVQAVRSPQIPVGPPRRLSTVVVSRTLATNSANHRLRRAQPYSQIRRVVMRFAPRPDSPVKPPTKTPKMPAPPMTPCRLSRVVQAISRTFACAAARPSVREAPRRQVEQTAGVQEAPTERAAQSAISATATKEPISHPCALRRTDPVISRPFKPLSTASQATTAR